MVVLETASHIRSRRQRLQNRLAESSEGLEEGNPLGVSKSNLREKGFRDTEDNRTIPDFVSKCWTGRAEKIEHSHQKRKINGKPQRFFKPALNQGYGFCFRENSTDALRVYITIVSFPVEVCRQP